MIQSLIKTTPNFGIAFDSLAEKKIAAWMAQNGRSVHDSFAEASSHIKEGLTQSAIITNGTSNALTLKCK